MHMAKIGFTMAIFTLLLTACGLPAIEAVQTPTPESTQTAMEMILPATTEEPMPTPTPTPTPRPREQDYLGTWICGSEGFIVLSEQGEGEFFLATLCAPQRMFWTYDPMEGTITMTFEEETASARILTESDGVTMLVSVPSQTEPLAFFPGTDGDRQQIRRATGCAFLASGNCQGFL